MNTSQLTSSHPEIIWPVRMVKHPGLIVLCVIFFWTFSESAFCSQRRASTHENQDTLKSRPQSNHTVTGVSGYGNMLIPASVLSSSQSFYYGMLAYSYKNSLYFSAGSFHLEGYKPFLAFNSITSGYSHNITSWFDIDVSLSRYQIPERLETVLYKSFFYGNFTIGIDWNVARTGLSVSSLFSQTGSIFYHLKNSRYFQTPELSKKKIHVSFEPYINIVLGTMLKISTSEGIYTRVKSPIRRWGSISVADSESGQSSGSGAGPGQGNDSGGNSESSQGPAGGSGNNDPGTGNPDPSTGSGSGGSNNPGAGENGGSGAGYGDNSETGPGSEGSGSGTDAGQGTGSGTGSGKEYGQTGLNPETKSAAIAPAYNQQTTGEISYPTIYKISDFIGLMEIEAGLPIGFNTRRFIFEIEPGYVFPLYNDPEIPQHGGFSLMMNFYFKLF